MRRDEGQCVVRRMGFVPVSPPRGRRALAMLAIVSVCAGGCGGGGSGRFEELGSAPEQEEFVEVLLGSFMVPVPAVVESPDERPRKLNLVQFQFDLYALVQPDQQDELERLKSRHDGRIRDEVIRICRHTRVDDLSEPDLTTLKLHLLEATRPLLGGAMLRRLLVTNVLSNPL